MRTCTRCHMRLNFDEFRYVPSQSRYHSWCRVCERAARGTSSRVRRTRPTSSVRRSRRNVGRAFGVEIELTGPRRDIIEEALATIGIDVVVRGYAVTNGNNWELKHDGSVRGEGLELVSPKLYGEEGLATLEQVLTTLTVAGATVDRSCGIHVHIDFRGRSVQQIKDSIRPIVGSQSAIYDMCAPSRRSNTYSPMWRESHVQSMMLATDLAQIQYVGPRGFVNLGSYPRHGSIEFRSHGGSTNARKVLAWVRMIQAAVAYGESNPGITTLGATAADVCDTLNLSNADTQTLLRFVNAASELERIEYAGTVA